MPVEAGPYATRTPLLNRVTFCVLIDATSCSGPFGISPNLVLVLGLGFFPFDSCGGVLADRNVGNNKIIDLQP